MKKNTIIIDDERLARNELKKMLDPHPEIEIIGEAANVDEGLRLINEMNPDLIFLDVQMPVKTGFDLLQELEKLPTVIFTTAYDEYAIRAFEVNALDYLLKPIDPKRLSDAVQKFLAIDDKEMLFSENRSEIRLSLSESDQVCVKDG
jgi:two-component system LytT family response regulator